MFLESWGLKEWLGFREFKLYLAFCFEPLAGICFPALRGMHRALGLLCQPTSCTHVAWFTGLLLAVFPVGSDF